MSMRVGIVGAKGRMGLAVAEALADAGLDLAGGVDRGQDVATLANVSSVLIDFSLPAALCGTLAAAAEAGIPLVIGTTALGAAEHRAIDEAARRIPVMQSANMSLGVNLLAALVARAAARLGPEWDIEIVEMHHRHKVDAPSGTALLLGRAAAEGRGETLDTTARADSRSGARETGTIGFASLRGGSVAGDHAVILATEGERIELTHRAESRAIFARGAVRAAEWLIDRPAGRYSMADMLNL